MRHSLFRKKSIDAIMKESEEGIGDAHHSHSGLRKVLGVKDLTFMGIAAVIGAGIFSTIGAAAYNGGPGVIFLFLMTAVTCGFTALCYAEFASRVPVAGSAYTYSYVTFGEMIAWIIGWALILEYAIGNIVVAISWSSYFNNVLKAIGINLPSWLTTGYQTARDAYYAAVESNLPVQDLIYTNAPTIGGFHFIINLPAFIIVGLVTLLAYIGFDAISTTAEECSNPQRDLPRGMIYSLIICTVIYVIIALVITGMVNYKEFAGVTDPLAYVFDKINMQKVGFVISISAVIAATSVLLVFQLGQPRIWMTMSRDGLLPASFGKISKKYRTPGFATIVSGILVGGLVLFVDDKLMTDLTSIGTLFAFVLVSGGVLMLPYREKETGKFQLPYVNGKWIIPLLFMVFFYFSFGRFKDAFSNFNNESYQELLFILFVIMAAVITLFSFLRNYSLIPVLGVLCCLYLMIEIPAKSWMVFFGWMALGLSIYRLYGYRHSRLSTKS